MDVPVSENKFETRFRQLSNPFWFLVISLFHYFLSLISLRRKCSFSQNYENANFEKFNSNQLNECYKTNCRLLNKQKIIIFRLK